MVSHRIRRILPTGTYHNLYAIIIVVTAFNMMESARLTLCRSVCTFEFRRSWYFEIDIHVRSPIIIPGSIDSAKGNSFPENVYSPTPTIQRMSGMRNTHCRFWKSTQALQMTTRSLRIISTNHEWIWNPIVTAYYSQERHLPRS